MKLEYSNFKIYLGGLYLIVLFAAIYFFWSTFDLKDLTSYDLIKENREVILTYKDNNIFFLTIIFFYNYYLFKFIAVSYVVAHFDNWFYFWQVVGNININIW